MNVRDLIVRLSAMDPNDEVWLSSDAEGNSFADLVFIGEENVNLYDYSVVDDDSLDLYDPSEINRAVVLWP